MSGKAQWWLGTGVVVSPLDHNPKMAREDDIPFLVHSQGGALVSWGGGGGGLGCCCGCACCVWGWDGDGCDWGWDGNAASSWEGANADGRAVGMVPMLRHNKHEEDALVVANACGVGNEGLPVECGGCCACPMDGIHDEKEDEARLRTLTDGMLGDDAAAKDKASIFALVSLSLLVVGCDTNAEEDE